MARKSSGPGPYRRTFIKEWREYRQLTQEKLAERIDSSAAHISRLETGRSPYNQGLLEALAGALNCDPEDLISRRPGQVNELWAIIKGLDKPQIEQAVRVIRALTGRAA